MTEIIATYLLHGEKSPAKKAEEIALGLTVGSWTNLPELEKNQLRKHKGRVVSIEDFHSEKDEPSIIRIAYPTVNFSNDLPAILTTVFGKLSLDGKIKLLDLEFGQELKNQFQIGRAHV